jgi:hypothetical protein
MTTNLLLNGDFTNPVITGNPPDIDTNTLTTNQKSSLIWDCFGRIALLNVLNPPVNFGYPSLIGLPDGSRFIDIQDYQSQGAARLKQTVNITQKGTYQINLKYVARPGYIFLPIQIFFNGNLINTITTSVSTWTSYTITFNISSTGSQELLFLGQNSGQSKEIAIGNISLTLIQAVSTIVKFENNRFLQSNDYSMNKQIFNKTFIGKEEKTNNPLKKWHDNNKNRDASNITIKYKINEQGIPFTNTNEPNLNDVNNALRRVRSGGYIPPKKKSGIGMTPSFPVTPLIRTNNKLYYVPISNKMAMLSKPNLNPNNNIQQFH